MPLAPAVAPVPRLVSLKVSPWSERAKWALDHHGIAYRVVEHVPVLGERRLRRLVGPRKARATVPVLVGGGEPLIESWDIAVHADRVGRGSKLIPPEKEADVRRWARVADDAMEAGRALVLAGMMRTPAALDESAPPLFPRWLRPALRPVARGVVRAFARKYDVRLDDASARTAGMRAGLDELRKGLQDRGSSGRYLLGAFSYADIVMATLIQGIAPVADSFIRLGPGTRRAWTQDELAREYADLVAWRDQLYETERRARA